MKFRQSTIKTFQQCALRFRFQDEGAEREQSSASSFGSIIHEAVLAMEVAADMQVGITHFDTMWDNLEKTPYDYDYLLPRNSHRSYSELGHKVLRDWWALIQWESDIVLAREYYFEVDIGNGNTLQGTLDKLALRPLKEGGYSVLISDYKTSSKQPTRDYLAHDIQFSSYCVDGSTPVLMQDYTWKLLRDIAVGDEVMGFDEHTSGSRRRWNPAIVTAHWKVNKEAYLIKLSDGRSVTASADHRWLTLSPGTPGATQRLRDQKCWFRTDQLKVGDRLSAVFQNDTAIKYDSDDYYAGYISGATLGDGSFRWIPGQRSSSMGYPQPFWTIMEPEFDQPIISRLDEYLRSFGVIAHQFYRQPNLEPSGKSFPGTVPMTGLRTSSLIHMPIIADLLSERDTQEYRAGWLAGLFDTDGHGSSKRSTLSIAQKDIHVLERVVEYASKFGLHFKIVDRSTSATSGSIAELKGDRMERVRFASICRPALVRKCESLDGRTVRIFDAPAVVSVEPVGKKDLYDISTSSRTFVANGLLTHNCYATTRPEFWTGIDNGAQLYKDLIDAPREGEWVHLRLTKRITAGNRTQMHYNRLMYAIEQMQLAIDLGIFFPNISGETCEYCEFRKVCGLPSRKEEGLE